MNEFTLEIVTPTRQVFKEPVTMVSVPTLDGTIGVLAGHEPLFSALTEGEIKITVGNKEIYLAIGGGFMEVTAASVTILVSRAVHAAELNEAEIKKAYEQAKIDVKKKGTGMTFASSQALLRQSLVELKVLRR